MSTPASRDGKLTNPSSSPSADPRQGVIIPPKSPPPEDEVRGRTRARRAPTPQIEGYHTFKSMGRTFIVEKRWKYVREMGVGAFGAVVSAQDSISGETVAIKQVTRVYDKLAIARRVLRELALLRHLQGHLHITGLIDMDMLSKDANEIYIFMEPMEADLHQIIRSGQELSNDHVAYFMYQILCAMKFIHASNVMHRDLKPGNILVNSSCAIRICDFGLARGYQPKTNDMEEKASQLTDYVATRWYRAPEIMLGFQSYTDAIDIWSIGCILAELFLGKPAFQGRDYVDQLNCIFAVLGSPSEDVLSRIAKGRARKYVRGLPWRKAKTFEDWIPSADVEALDLLSKMLQYVPENRISAADGLEHPWLVTFQDVEEESLSPSPKPFVRWKQIESLETTEEFREAIWNEIQDYRSFARSSIDDLVVTTTGDLVTKEFAEQHGLLAEPEPEQEQPTVVVTKNHTNSPQAITNVGSVLTPPPSETPPTKRINLPAEDKLDDLPPATLRQRTRTLSHADPFTTARRTSIFSVFPSSSIPEHEASVSPVKPAPTSSISGLPSTSSSLAQWPLMEDEDASATTPNANGLGVTYIRSRVGSIIDSVPSGYRHLRTLSTVSVTESGSRPGGLEAIAPIGKYIGATKTAGAEAPPSSPPPELLYIRERK